MNNEDIEITDDESNAAVEMAASTMLGDLMAVVIDEVKAAPDVWQKLSQDRQDAMINRVEKRVRENVTQAIEIIASASRPTIAAHVESVTVKDGIKAVLTLSKSDAQRHQLFDAAGSVVLLVVAGGEYYGGASNVKSDPDQPELPIDESEGAGDTPVADNGEATAIAA